ncbi:MAG TPA: tetratricopeptide repeat protein [Myxococcota bacterium]
MRKIDTRFELETLRGPAAAFLVAALIASGCVTSGGARPAQVEREESGFTIIDDARVGFGVRADFEDAVRLIEEEQYEDAIALLLEVTQAAPQLATPHIDLGIAYRELGDLERAEASLARALELSPRHPVAYNEMGIVYRKTGRFAEARESYERALAIHPDFLFARRNLAILCDIYLRDLRCALEHYELYSEAVPEDEAVTMWIADLRNRVEE